MNSAPSISKQLVEGIHSDARYPSFGGRIAELTEPTIERGGKYFSPEATRLIAGLIQAVNNLNNSFNASDEEVLPYANLRFRDDDMRLFREDMGDKLGSEPNLNIYRWIAEPRIDHYRDIALLAIWNRDRQRAVQEQLNKDTPDLLAHAMMRVDYLVEQGVYPKETPDLYHNSILRHGTYRAMDSFEAGLMGGLGWCDDDTGAVSLSNMYQNRRALEGLTTQFTGVAYHEETHSMGVGRGFFRGIATPHHPLRVWEEFWASHSQASTDNVQRLGFNGHPYMLNPDNRVGETRYYPAEGRYVWNIHKLTGEGIPADLIGHAYTSEFDPKDPSPERMELEDWILDVFGSTEEWFDIEDTYEAQETHEDRDRHLANAILRMHGHAPIIFDEFVELDLADEMPVDIVTEKLVD